MAKKKAAALDLSPEVDLFNIKLADGKTKKNAKPDQLEIKSPMDDDDNVLVDECIKLAQDIENKQVELADMESTLKTTASDAVKKEKAAGNFVKTVNVMGTDLRIQVQFRDAYSKMDWTMREPLQKIFNDKYAVMFSETIVETLRPEKVSELKTLLGDRFDAFFQTDKSIKPTTDFQYNYFALRSSLKPEQHVVVQKILDACQSSPAIKYPK